MGITRRELLKATAYGAVVSGIGLPVTGFGADRPTIKIGILAPLTGPVAAWGLPGLYGLEVRADQINAAGGVKLGGEHYNIEILSYDSAYQPAKALEGYKKLVAGEGVKLVMMLGGNPWPAVQRFANHYKMLTTTLLPSDLTPDTPYLLAPAEVHPVYNVTGVEWMANQYPDLKTVAMCAQNDSLGLPSLSTYEAAFEAANIELVDENVFSPSTTNFAPIVSSLLAKNPDILCLDTAYSDFVNLICQQAHFQGYEGRIISCTCDNYHNIVDKTGAEFMNGFVFQFPDFDDPALNQDFINFNDPGGFYAEYIKRHPGMWTAVSWEYPSILDLWKWGAEQAGSAEPMDVLETMKGSKTAPAIWGDAEWWGKDLWGIDNALVGNWPVVQLNAEGKARIQGFGNIPEWWNSHGEILLARMRARNLLS